MTAPPVPVRASDADRRRVVEVLCRGHVDGRLTLVELEDRSATAYAARTWEDLAPLTADLPLAGGPPLTAHTHPAAHARALAGPPVAPDEAPYVVFVVLVAAWIALVAALGVFIPPLPVLIFLLFRAMAARRWHAA